MRLLEYSNGIAQDMAQGDIFSFSPAVGLPGLLLVLGDWSSPYGMGLKDINNAICYKGLKSTKQNISNLHPPPAQV